MPCRMARDPGSMGSGCWSLRRSEPAPYLGESNRCSILLPVTLNPHAGMRGHGMIIVELNNNLGVYRFTLVVLLNLAKNRILGFKSFG
jgi:hypothetical protein